MSMQQAKTSANCLKAIFIGEEALSHLAKPDFCGSVHSVFRHALNILSTEGNLITVLSTNERAPWWLTVTPNLEFIQFRIRPETNVRTESGILFLGSDLHVDLRTAELWKTPNLSCQQKQSKAKEIGERVRQVTDTLSVMETRGGFGELLDQLFGKIAPSVDPFVRTAQPRIECLMSAIVQRRIDLIDETCGALAGLGKGATPSGDDFLAGLMLGFRYAMLNLGGDYQYSGFVCKAILEATRGKTSIISKGHLEYASRGLATESTFAFMSSLLEGKEELVQKTVVVLEKGATSGEDIIVGIVHGIVAAMRHRHAA